MIQHLTEFLQSTINKMFAKVIVVIIIILNNIK